MDTLETPRPFHVIGLYAPASGSGKTTAARYLQQSLGLIPLSFADPIKRQALRFLYSFAPTQNMTEAYQWAQPYFVDKNRPIHEIPGRPRLRDILEGIGEGLRDRVHSDVWVEIARREVERIRQGIVTGNAPQAPIAGVVFDDVRRENEARLIESLGGLLIQIQRPGVAPQPGVKTEGQLEGYPFAATLLNAGDKKALYQLIMTRVAALLVPSSGNA